MSKKNLDFFKLTDLPPRITGLPVTVWASVKLEGKQPIVRILEEECEIAISISDDPKIVEGTCNLSNDEIKQIYAWIKINKEVLLQHWKMKIDSFDLIKNVRTIE